METTNNNRTGSWRDWTNGETAVTWTVDYNADAALSDFVECNLEDAAAVAERVLGEYRHPDTFEECEKIENALRSAAEALFDRADSMENGESSSALYREAREIEKAANDFDISQDSHGWLQQIRGDDDLAEMLGLVDRWDREFGQTAWSVADGEFLTARTAWDRALGGSRSGGSFFELRADESGLTISCSGYACDMTDVSMRVVEKERAALLVDLSGVEEQTIDAVVALTGREFRLLVEIVSLWDNSLWAEEMHRALEAVQRISALDGNDVACVLDTLSSLALDWSGEFSELVETSLLLTMEAAR